MDPIWVIALFGLYIVPSLIAAVRRPTMTLFVISLNLLLGWTLVAWFVSLALAILMPPASAGAASPAQSPNAVAGGAVTPATPPPPGQVDFVIDPRRVAALSLFAPVIYQYWWFWRFFEFARRQGFPRSRSFWWILVPFYGWAVIGRLFHDLQARLGAAQPSRFNAQVALALIVAANVSAGWGVRMSSIPFIVGGLALSCVFTALALYQVQIGVNAYLRQTYATAPESGLFPGEAIAVVFGLAMLGLLVLGTPQRSAQPATQLTAGSIVGPSAVPTNLLPPATPMPSPTGTPAPTPTGDYLLRMTSEPGDYIGQGRSTTMGGPAWRLLPNVSSESDTVTVSFETVDTTHFTRWTVWLGAPRGQALRPGTYLNAQRAAFRTGSTPGIDVFGDGRGCNNVYGSFTVTKVSFDQQGTVQSFEATFEQHCESPTAPALRGYVRFGTAATDQ